MIDFELDEEQQLIRETVTTFAAEQLRPAAREADETGVIPESLVRTAWDLGLIQGSVPESYGGYASGDPSAVTGAIVAEGLAEGDLAIALHLLSPRLVVDPVLRLGSEEQKKAILPIYMSERFTPGSAAVVEPWLGFHFTKMKTTARRDGNDYVLDGTKCQVVLAASAPHIVVYAAAEGGIGAFVVPGGTAGLTIGEREKNLGLRGLETYEIRLDGCRVPASARLGGDATPMLRRSRVAQSAMAVGIAKASLDYAITYAKERDAFGVKIAQKQAIAFMIADMATETEAARLLNFEAAWNLDQGGDGSREVAIAHRYSSDMAMTVTDNGLQVLGGHGFIRDHPVEMWARNARGFAIFEGIASV
ncbi:MAG TPA: acyl-CoA dehydrogenase family protein [Candidatus Binatia bacterium]|jgi:alkylation response protein AidB-like acyl-CoA dehydrogenase